MNTYKKSDTCNALDELKQLQMIVLVACGVFSLAAATIMAIAEDGFCPKFLFGPAVITLAGLWNCRGINLDRANQLLRKHSTGWGRVTAQASAAAILFSGFLQAGFLGYKQYSIA